MLRSIIFCFLVLYFQIFKAGDLSIWGITPNFLIPLSAYLGAYQKEKWALPLVFVIGMAYDLVIPETLGLGTLLLLFICWITIILKKTIMEPKLVTVAVLSLIYNFFYYLIFGLFYSLQTENFSFLVSVFLLSLIINSLYSVIMFYLLLLLSHIKIVLD
jgi:rod shape-determining protein MreD